MRDIEMIAPRLRLKAGRTIGGDAVAELAFRALEAAAVSVLLRKLPLSPRAVYQNAHL